jgi:hypothetical protein
MECGFTGRAVELTHIPPPKLKRWAFIHDPVQRQNWRWTAFWIGAARYSPSFICRDCQVYMVEYGISWTQKEAREIARQFETEAAI